MLIRVAFQTVSVFVARPQSGAAVEQLGTCTRWFLGDNASHLVTGWCLKLKNYIVHIYMLLLSLLGGSAGSESDFTLLKCKHACEDLLTGTTSGRKHQQSKQHDRQHSHL